MGRPPGRIQDRIFRMRASDTFLKSVDAWRRKQPDIPTRSEAIRRLVERALISERKRTGIRNA
jgi:metal-responsive CopG/Arc/MetJ family transcriptional regulator